MIGLILCGGQSSRMGTDKGLIGENQSWAARAKSLLEEVKITTFLSINKTQSTTYEVFFERNILIYDNKNIELKGPMLGILSCFEQQKDDIFVLACDMPFMEINILAILLENYHQNPNYETYLFENQGNIEPLCGIYTVKGLQKIQYLLKTKQVEKFSMKYFLSKLNTHISIVPDFHQQNFQNINTIEDV